MWSSEGFVHVAAGARQRSDTSMVGCVSVPYLLGGGINNNYYYYHDTHVGCALAARLLHHK